MQTTLTIVSGMDVVFGGVVWEDGTCPGSDPRRLPLRSATAVEVAEHKGWMSAFTRVQDSESRAGQG